MNNPDSRYAPAGADAGSDSGSLTRVALIRRLPELLSELGVDADATLADCGLSRADFRDVDNALPYQRVEAALNECTRRTGLEHFGLLLCERTGLDDIGLPGRVARCAPTVREGLVEMNRIYNRWRGGSVLSLVESGDIAQFVFAAAVLGSLDTRQYQIASITIVRNILQELCGPDWRPAEVRLAVHRPAHTRPFLSFFGTAVQFDADESMIVLEREWLGRALPPVEDAYRKAVAAEIRAARDNDFREFPVLVRDLIRRQIPAGTCSIHGIAAALSMHRRTLDRRLARHGESYRSLADAVKYETARRLLRETDLSVQQVAEYLRYSSAANFSTAFRRWAGRSPRDFRAGER
jgi:AraC-like DNA-binding protein